MKARVIGGADSGKTVATRASSARLDIPVTHWRRRSPARAGTGCRSTGYAARQRDTVHEPVRVVGGHHPPTMPIRLAAAKAIVVRNAVTTVALQDEPRRWWTYRGGRHGNGIHVRLSFEVLGYAIWLFRRRRPCGLTAVRGHVPGRALCAAQPHGLAHIRNSFPSFLIVVYCPICGCVIACILCSRPVQQV